MKTTDFEWNEDKERINIVKHGIDFETATGIWDGPMLQRIDDRFDYGETRFVAFGEVDGRVLAVVYTWRGDACRIISARMANRHERRAYRETVAGLAPDEED